jgi:hypothetical protein
LKIDVLGRRWLVDTETDIPALFSLGGYVSLEHLKILGIVLWGNYSTLDYSDLRLSTVLPTSLKSLVININRGDDIEDTFNTWLPNCSISLSKLKIIECFCWPIPKAFADHLKGA